MFLLVVFSTSHIRWQRCQELNIIFLCLNIIFKNITKHLFLKCDTKLNMASKSSKYMLLFGIPENAVPFLSTQQMVTANFTNTTSSI